MSPQKEERPRYVSNEAIPAPTTNAHHSVRTTPEYTGDPRQPESEHLDDGDTLTETSSGEVSVTPYADGWQTYHRRGWPSMLPLPYRGKKIQLRGYTGDAGVYPSYADMMTWGDDPASNRGGGNIALRMPDDVVGIDKDCYGGKPGAQTIAEAEQRWGALPPAPYSTSRDDGSGISFFRVPPGTRLKDVIVHGGGVEIVQRHHRYAVVWPSIHPDGRPYLWYGADGQVLDEPPSPELHDLPTEWIDGLRAEPTARDDTIGGAEATQIVRDALTGGEPTFNVSKRLSVALGELNTPGGRYDATRDHALFLLRLGHLGEPGVASALAALGMPTRPPWPTHATAASPPPAKSSTAS